MNRRALEIGVHMTAHPEDSLPHQMQGWAELIGAYRLMNHPKVTLSALLEPHCAQTLAQAGQYPVVLWVEDTTELDFTPHPAMRGLGPIGDGKGRGLLLHSTLAVLPGQRQVLGLGAVQVVLRQPKPKKSVHWADSPEARLWQESAHRVGRPPENCLWVHVSDSGSDMFGYLAACRQNHKHFLVRAFHNRLLAWEERMPQAEQAEAKKLMTYARSLAPHPHSAYTVQVAATRKHPARQAQVVLAWAFVTLPVPARSPAEKQQADPLPVWVVRAWEPNPPPQVEPLEWILLSSLPVASLAEAQEKVSWYTHRWLCEDFHQCLKTGCKIEDSQLDHGADIQTLLGFAAPIAVRLLQMRQAVRVLPHSPAGKLIDPQMVEILARLLKIQAQPMSIEQFWLGVARLGGYLGRKHDGPPGWRTLWRGWRYLSDLTFGARLAQDTS